MHNTTSIADRRYIARTELRGALEVPNAKAVKGKHILICDDVFTDGSTLNEVARKHKNAGAQTVSGLTLARQPWDAERAQEPATATLPMFVAESLAGSVPAHGCSLPRLHPQRAADGQRRDL